jgi:hypothetical protein
VLVIAFFWEKKVVDMLLSQPQPGGFNMEPCRACEEKRLSHIETTAEKRCKHKNQPPTLADF